jgi:hypothetical protein
VALLIARRAIDLAAGQTNCDGCGEALIANGAPHSRPPISGELYKPVRGVVNIGPGQIGARGASPSDLIPVLGMLGWEARARSLDAVLPEPRWLVRSRLTLIV